MEDPGDTVRRRVPRLLVGVLVAQLALGGIAVLAVARNWSILGRGDGVVAPVDPTSPDARRIFAEVQREVALGPRPAGSSVSRRLAADLRARLPRGRFEAVPGAPGLRNVVGSLPGRRPAVVVAAHYDTKALPGFVGANDGAGGTAVVLELARALRARPHPRDAPEVRFVLFDGEESTDDARPFDETGLRGSRAYARAHAHELRALVLVDFVGQRRLSLPRESGSDPDLWDALRAAARRVGVQAVLPDARRGEIQDDHTPFNDVGVPAIDLIDFDYPCFHRRCDTPARLSPSSLAAAERAVLELLRTTLARAPSKGSP